MEIIKASGKKEKFSEKKIQYSLRKIGMEEREIFEILQSIKREIHFGISSKKILEIILNLIKDKSPVLAAKYNLKSAIMNLGPSGYPFEKYFAGILEEYGYTTRVGEIVKGFCADQEVDIIAVKSNKHLMIECKYHNTAGARSDLKVTLYTYARFLDVKEVWEKDKEHSEKFHQAVLVTNTKYTSSAIKFAKCRGIKMIGWHYPARQNLESLIEDKSLYPITILFSLEKSSRSKFLKKGIVFVRDLIDIDVEKTSQELGISINEIKCLQKEAKRIYE